MEGFSPLLMLRPRAGGRCLRAWLMTLAALLSIAAPAEAQRRKQPQSYAVIAGTVFQETGMSLPGAQITVTALESEGGRKVTKAVRGTSNAQGEFAIRVPAGSMRYNVKAEARGFEPAEKEVQVEWDQRVEVFFRLKAVQGAEKRQ